MNKILLVDDDVELYELLREYLKPEGFEMEAVHNGADAIKQVLANDYQIIVLDIMLPGMNGLEVLRGLRAESNIPVLMLTARGDDIDRIVGLEMGADDYLPKPCNPRELVARLRAILRRADVKQKTPEIIKQQGLEIHTASHEVFYQDTLLELTLSEYNILLLLIENSGEMVTKQQLYENALGKSMNPFDRSLDMHISNLRNKLSVTQVQIKTVRAVGYMVN